MSPTEFEQKYLLERRMYSDWGAVVRREILDLLVPHMSADCEKLVILAPRPRTKSIKSIIDKAFYRGINFGGDPYQEIKDKVGIRFVVLRTGQISLISKIVEDSKIWTTRPSRDYERERIESPTIFDYQSKHYIVECLHDLEYHGKTVKSGTPCEVQIRTLMQHAHSEMSHDTVYKPQKVKATADIHRSLARSVALIEATDMVFDGVAVTIKTMNSHVESDLKGLQTLYFEHTGIQPDSDGQANSFILDALSRDKLKFDINDVRVFLSQHQNIGDKIKAHRNTNRLFELAVSLYVYYCAHTRSNDTKEFWPLPQDELAPFYNDLGISPP